MNKLPDRTLTRRQFLNRLLASSIIGAGSVNPSTLKLLSSPAFASHGTDLVPKTLVNMMLYGGADLRYLIAPSPSFDANYVNQYWLARRNLYNGSYTSYADMFANEYTEVTDPISRSLTFGIHNSSGWLASQFSAGNVAVISNTYGSLNRRHDHSQLIIQTGDLVADRNIYSREGWGGRLVETLSDIPLATVIELSGEVQIFCNGSDAGYRLAQVIHARDTRDMGLQTAVLGGTSRDDAQIRALTAYYNARSAEIDADKPADWPYRKFFQHHFALRKFGALMNTRLADHPIPASLAGLTLNSGSFAQQCRGLYDICLAPDILNFRVASMSYGGWDTHIDQTPRMNSNLQDIFGTNAGLDTVMTALNADAPSAALNLVFSFPWDFGRQLAANGSNGTDHGRGSYMILIGNSLQGGLYGELFPLKESLPDPNDSQGRTPYEISGRDIDGLTSLEHVWARICEWLEPGSSATVFPGYLASPIEGGLNLSTLF